MFKTGLWHSAIGNVCKMNQCPRQRGIHRQHTTLMPSSSLREHSGRWFHGYLHQPVKTTFMVATTGGSESQCVGRVPTTAGMVGRTRRDAATQKQTAETTTPPTAERCRCHDDDRTQWWHHAAVADTTASVRHDVTDTDVTDADVTDADVTDADVADATFRDCDWSEAAGRWRTPGFSRAADSGKLCWQIFLIRQCFVIHGILPLMYIVFPIRFMCLKTD